VVYPHGEGQGACHFQFSGLGDSHANVPSFLIHNDAIAGFTNQSRDLSAYAYVNVRQAVQLQ